MNAKGFTLIELLVTLAIVAVLALLTVPVAEVAVQRANEATLKDALRELRDAIDAYKKASDEGRVAHSPNTSGYPPSLQALVDGVEDAKDPNKAKIYFLRRIPRDPMSDDASAEPADSWGKRSYTSEPDDPAEGDDVYDVYSKSTQSGLNGVPYRKW